jgi:hypothetical protein
VKAVGWASVSLHEASASSGRKKAAERLWAEERKATNDGRPIEYS